MDKNIRVIQIHCEQLPPPEQNTNSLLSWLGTEAQTHDLRFALSHHDDGVLWGCWTGSEWIFASPHGINFARDTLQECRAFGETTEVFLWRNGNSLQGRQLVEGKGDGREYFDVSQLLWGDKPDSNQFDPAHFTVMREGSRGIVQAIPLPDLCQRARLTIRHYVDYQNHCAYIKWSRLVGLTIMEE